MTTNANPCGCGSCNGDGCTCGCQSSGAQMVAGAGPRLEPGCRCGAACGCGDGCQCDDGCSRART